MISLSNFKFKSPNMAFYADASSAGPDADSTSALTLNLHGQLSSDSHKLSVDGSDCENDNESQDLYADYSAPNPCELNKTTSVHGA